MNTIQLTKENILLPSYRGRLTEGISYNKRNNSVLWVDIILAELHRVFLDTNKHQVIKHEKQGESVGTMAFTEDDDIYIVGTKTGISRADFKTGKFTLLAEYPDGNPKLRSNDGKVDPWGNLLIGTMYDFPYEDDLKPEGSFYRVSPDLQFETLETNCYIPNGMGFNHARTKFYWIDTITQCIWQFDYDESTSKFSNKREFFNVVEKIGFPPDGMSVSDKDELWVATFGGSQVVRIDMQGNILQVIKLPAKQITCVTVCDDQVFINTCLIGSSDLSIPAELTLDGDLGGYIFRCSLQDTGCEEQHVYTV